MDIMDTLEISLNNRFDRLFFRFGSYSATYKVPPFLSRRIEDRATTTVEYYTTNFFTDMVLPSLHYMETLVNWYIRLLLPKPLAEFVTTITTNIFRILPRTMAMIDYTKRCFTYLLSSNGGSAEGSALISTIVLLLTFYVAFKILNYIRRSIFGWIVLAVKLCIVLIAVQALIYINTYGWDKAMNDATWVGNMMYDFAEDAIQNAGLDDNIPRGMRPRKSVHKKAKPGRARWT